MSNVTITIKDKTISQKGMYSINTDGPFDICFNMDGSSTNVTFTAEFIDTNIWKLSNITGDTLSVTIKDPA